MKTLLTAFIMLLLVSFAHADTKGRIMTNGKVSMYKNGKVVNSFTKQGPIDENAIIACDGNCLVKIKGLSLIAKDKTKFAIKELPGSISLYVETGTLNFAASDTSKQFSFYTPDGLVQSQGFITPASTDKSVKGFVESNNKGSKIGMDKGSMMVLTANGTQTIGEGQTLLLAQVPSGKNDEGNSPSGAVIPGGSGGGGAGLGGTLGGGIGGGTIGFAGVVGLAGATAATQQASGEGGAGEGAGSTPNWPAGSASPN